MTESPDSLPPGWTWESGPNGIVQPLAPPPDPNEPKTEIVRFLYRRDGRINNRPIRKDTIAELPYVEAMKLSGRDPTVFPDQQGAVYVEPASRDELLRYEATMKAADENEPATAQDAYCQKIAAQFKVAKPGTPMLIVRFTREGGNYVDGSYASAGEVWPVERELAFSHLLTKNPIAELATPEELKRDRDIIDRTLWQLKSQVEATRKQRFKEGTPPSGPMTLAVRLLTEGRFSIHMKQGVIFEKQAESCETLPCFAGEIWEIEQGFAHRILRGKSPVGELVTDAEWEAYRTNAKSVEPTKPVDQGKLGRDNPTTKTKRRTSKNGAREKLVSALTHHHQYSNGGCGEFEPISINGLARLAKVVPSTAFEFFKKYFEGHENYQRGCAVSATLIAALKLLNSEFTPSCLIQRDVSQQPDLNDEG